MQMTKLVTNLNIVAPPADTVLLNPDIVAGRWLQTGEAKALVVADSIYKYYPDLKPGDTIRVKLSGKIVEEWTVVGVFRFMDMLGDTLAYADSSTIASLQNMNKRSSSFRLITDEHTGQKQKEIARYLETYLKEQGLSVSSIDTGSVLQEDSAKAITILVSFLLVMALLDRFCGQHWPDWHDGNERHRAHA